VTAATVLEAAGLTRAFGGVAAVRDVSLRVDAGELRGIIGPNGAGKSTLFNLITGQLRPDRGTLAYRGERIDGLPPHKRAARGIAIAFQGARLFRGMTALENVMVGAHTRARHGFVSAALRLPRCRREERAIRGHALQALERVGLAEVADQPAELLGLGQQRGVQVARALCAAPSLLLLDEPASGLRAPERAALVRLLEQLHAEGLTMLLIEHDVALVSRVADRVTVLDLGQVVAEGTPEAVRADPRVIASYLGTTDPQQPTTADHPRAGPQRPPRPSPDRPPEGPPQRPGQGRPQASREGGDLA
jgi:branched-chain amino acid transport system ATP-binding protein